MFPSKVAFKASKYVKNNDDSLAYSIGSYLRFSNNEAVRKNASPKTARVVDEQNCEKKFDERM